MNGSTFSFILCDWGIGTPTIGITEWFDYGYFCIEYIDSGRGTLESLGKRYELSPGDVYILHQHQSHRYWPDPKDPYHKIYAMFSGTLVKELVQLYGLEKVCYLPQIPEVRPYFEMLLQMPADKADNRAALLLHQLLERASSLAADPYPDIPKNLIFLKKALESRLDQPFVLEDYAEKTDISVSHLVRGFKQHFGKSPYEYRTSLRMEMAEKLLAHTRLRVKEIADRLAFSDPYSFSESFKRHVGTSPKEYRQRKQNQLRSLPSEE